LHNYSGKVHIIRFAMGEDRATVVEELLAEGSKLCEAGHADQAIAVWTEVLHLVPGEARAVEYLKQAAAGQDEAENELRRSVSEVRTELEHLLSERRYEEALELLYAARRRNPNAPDIARGIQLLKQRLVRRYLHRLGNLDHVPRTSRAPAEYGHLPEEARTLLRLCDGVSSYGDVARASRLGRYETYRMLAQLVEEEIITTSGQEVEEPTMVTVLPVGRRHHPRLWLAMGAVAAGAGLALLLALRLQSSAAPVAPGEAASAPAAAVTAADTLPAAGFAAPGAAAADPTAPVVAAAPDLAPSAADRAQTVNTSTSTFDPSAVATADAPDIADAPARREAEPAGDHRAKGKPAPTAPEPPAPRAHAAAAGGANHPAHPAATHVSEKPRAPARTETATRGVSPPLASAGRASVASPETPKPEPASGGLIPRRGGAGDPAAEPAASEAPARVAPPEPPPTATQPAPASPAPVPPAAHPSPTPAPPVPPPAAPPSDPGRLEADVTIAKLQVEGALPQSVVERGVARALPAFRACYAEAAGQAHRNAAAKIEAHVTLGETGQAQDVDVGAAPLPSLSDCLRRAARRIRSSEAPDVGTARVTFTLVFAPLGR
jgi:tetratricopeptide (TPR) repeat protein